MHNLANPKEIAPLLHDIGNKPVVMLGEGSHGTHEYDTRRTAISKKMIEEEGFNFIAVEGDWPGCYRINRYAKGYEEGGDDIVTILKKFRRRPTCRYGMTRLFFLTVRWPCILCYFIHPKKKHLKLIPLECDSPILKKMPDFFSRQKV